MKTVLLIVLAGVFNAIMDTLKDHYTTSVFAKCNAKFWDPSISWLNKYRSKIPFATTALVWLTDGWHVVKFLMLLCLSLALSTVWYETMLYYCLFTVPFTLVYWLLNMRIK